MRIAEHAEQVIAQLEGIIRESVKPLERIEGIKIVHLDGVGIGVVTQVTRTETADPEVLLRFDAALEYDMPAEVNYSNQSAPYTQNARERLATLALWLSVSYRW